MRNQSVSSNIDWISIVIYITLVILGWLNIYSSSLSGAPEDAVTIIHDYIKNSIKQAGEFWDELVETKDILKDYRLSKTYMERIFGKLIINDVLDSVQLTALRKNLRNPDIGWDADPENAWHWYNHIANVLKQSHPNTWLSDHIKVYEIFNELLYIRRRTENPSAMTAVSGPTTFRTLPVKPEEKSEIEEGEDSISDSVMEMEPVWDTTREANDEYDF